MTELVDYYFKIVRNSLEVARISKISATYVTRLKFSFFYSINRISLNKDISF